MKKFNYKKKYGQNFLQDEKVLHKIIDSVNVKEKDLIIEIGPGKGALTKYLVNLNVDVIAFEIDKEVAPFLEKIKSSNLKIIYKDFMEVSLEDYIDKNKYQNIWVVANIPYYITTPILEHITKSTIFISNLILMVQKEVADRLSSKPSHKLYGSSTVYFNYFYNIEKLFDVQASSFYPIPKVDSAVIKLTRKQEKLITNEQEFFSFIQDAFQFKRKNLRNNLKKYNLDNISKTLTLYNHNLQNRAEDISLKEFIDIFNNL